MSFDLVCPHCSRRARGATLQDGIRGTYREPTVRLAIRQITCVNCGYLRDVPLESGDDYELWFRVEVEGYHAWAVNEQQLRRLLAVLRDEVSQTAAGFDALPRWLLERRRRDAAIGKLQAMLDAPEPER